MESSNPSASYRFVWMRRDTGPVVESARHFFKKLLASAYISKPSQVELRELAYQQ